MRRASTIICAFFTLLMLCEGAVDPDGIHRRLPEFFTPVEAMLREFTELGRTCPYVRTSVLTDANATVELLRVDITDFAATKNRKEHILAVYGEHGREFITSEVALGFARVVCNPKSVPNIAAVPLLGQHSNVEEYITKVLRSYSFTIFPVYNPSSRNVAEKENLCNRRNANGVDLNRNWSYKWGQHMAGRRGNAEENPGPAPFSEPETRILRRVAKEMKPTVYVNIHSGTRELYMPWDHDATLPEGAPTQRMMGMLAAVNEAHCNCKMGGAGAIADYLAFGTSMDYMFAELSVPYSLTFEIYGGNTDFGRDCFGYFNPTTQETYDATVAKWSSVLFSISKYLSSQRPSLRPANVTQFGAPTVIDRLNSEWERLERAVTEGEKDIAGVRHSLMIEQGIVREFGKQYEIFRVQPAGALPRAIVAVVGHSIWNDVTAAVVVQRLATRFMDRAWLAEHAGWAEHLALVFVSGGVSGPTRAAMRTGRICENDLTDEQHLAIGREGQQLASVVETLVRHYEVNMILEVRNQGAVTASVKPSEDEGANELLHAVEAYATRHGGQHVLWGKDKDSEQVVSPNGAPVHIVLSLYEPEATSHGERCDFLLRNPRRPDDAVYTRLLDILSDAVEALESHAARYPALLREVPPLEARTNWWWLFTRVELPAVALVVAIVCWVRRPYWFRSALSSVTRKPGHKEAHSV